MIIESIKLKNYRQYRDQEVLFATPKTDQNFTIIMGPNGSGKTNILNAVTWCLYGNEMHISKKNQGLPIINTICAENLKLEDEIEVEVEIQMKDEDNRKTIFKRTLKYRKNREGMMNKVPDPLSGSSDGSRFMVFIQKGTGMQTASSPEFIVSRHIPESIEEFFFFDGERLNSYFREATGEKIREEVFKISQLDSLEYAINHLNTREKEFLRENRKLSPKANKIRDELNVYEKSLFLAYEDLKRLKRDKKIAEEKIEEYSEKLRINSSPNIEELENERINLEKGIEEYKLKIELLEKKRFDYLIEIAPIIFTYDAIMKTKKFIEVKEEAGDIPPDYKKNFLKKLLENGKCICGTNINEKNDCRARIEKLLQECEGITNISGELIREYTRLENLVDNFKKFRQKQLDLGKNHQYLRERMNKMDKRLFVINKKIEVCDINKIKSWNSKLKEYKKERDSLIREISVLEHRVGQGEKAKIKLKRELDNELKKEEKFKELREILKFCEISLDVAKGIKETIMEDIRKEIELKTKRQFFELIWKKETYSDVCIDQDYTISVVHESGWEGVGTLSAGERQVLALSFMAALNSVSGFDAPIIIDTPLGRLSRDPKNSIAQNLPKYLKGKQVVLLVTEEEYSPEVRERLYDKVGKEYRIYFKEAQEGSEAKVISYGE